MVGVYPGTVQKVHHQGDQVAKETKASNPKRLMGRKAGMKESALRRQVHRHH